MTESPLDTNDPLQAIFAKQRKYDSGKSPSYSDMQANIAIRSQSDLHSLPTTNRAAQKLARLRVSQFALAASIALIASTGWLLRDQWISKPSLSHSLPVLLEPSENRTEFFSQIDSSITETDLLNQSAVTDVLILHNVPFVLF